MTVFVHAEPIILQYTDNYTPPLGTLYGSVQSLRNKTTQSYAPHALHDGRFGISRSHRQMYLGYRVLVCEMNVPQESGYTSVVRVPKSDLPCGIMYDRKREQTDRAFRQLATAVFT